MRPSVSLTQPWNPAPCTPTERALVRLIPSPPALWEPLLSPCLLIDQPSLAVCSEWFYLWFYFIRSRDVLSSKLIFFLRVKRQQRLFLLLLNPLRVEYQRMVLFLKINHNQQLLFLFLHTNLYYLNLNQLETLQTWVLPFFQFQIWTMMMIWNYLIHKEM